MSQNSGFHTAAQRVSLHVITMAQRLTTHPDWEKRECILHDRKAGSPQSLKVVSKYNTNIGKC